MSCVLKYRRAGIKKNPTDRIRWALLLRLKNLPPPTKCCLCIGAKHAHEAPLLLVGLRYNWPHTATRRAGCLRSWYDAFGDVGPTFRELVHKKRQSFLGEGAENSKRIVQAPSSASHLIALPSRDCLFGPLFSVGNVYSAPFSHTKRGTRRRLFGPLFTMRNGYSAPFSHTKPVGSCT
jgi:hypothetical protein